MAVDDMVEKKSRRRRNRDEEPDEEIEMEEEAGETRGYTAGKGRATPGKRNKEAQKQEKPNFFVQAWHDFVGYLRGVQDELDKVVWPDREELVRLTRIVLSVTISSSIVLGIIALVFTFLFAQGLKQPIIFVAFAVAVGALYAAWRQSRGSSTNAF